MSDSNGAPKRKVTSFHNFIEKGGKFEPEKGRYHLYVAYSCPWATRTLIMRQLKGLEDIIEISVVSPRMGHEGWPFAKADAFPGATSDPIHDSAHIKELYFRAEPEYGGRFTVPMLWDKKTDTVVNNESSEIIRIFNNAFNELLPAEKAKLDFYPEELRKEIDEVNSWVLTTVNSGVYKAGFARTQAAYEAAVIPLFESLDRLEKILTGKDYLIGDRLTEADVRLFPTIVRFDPVYANQFKCNLRLIRDGYPAIHRWLRRLYWTNPAFKDTCNFEHIKTNYYWSTHFEHLNPTQIIPIGPVPNILPLEVAA